MELTTLKEMYEKTKASADEMLRAILLINQFYGVVITLLQEMEITETYITESDLTYARNYYLHMIPDEHPDHDEPILRLILKRREDELNTD